MIRQHLVPPGAGEKDFHWRGGEISRLEGFSDAVFAFAVTLLVVSLEVPKSYHELMDVMRGFVAFGICFALLAEVWFNHYRYFRRFGLQDSWAVFLNCVLLFFVLFFVYPLKFLFYAIFRTGFEVQAHEVRTLFVVYGAGYAAVFLTFALLYLHAWNKRHELELSQLEIMKTRHSMVDHFAMVGMGIISALLAVTLPLKWVGLAGYFYFMIGVYFTVAGSIYGRRERLLKERHAASHANPAR
jgi:uncharacterized membrane protein